MAQNFIACDREQELLLPPSLREWLPEQHLAWFVLDAVAEMELAAFRASYRDDGWGRAAHDPAMMVALFVYAYAIGVRSSRAIERRCHDDVAFRVITANRAPDHATIARFRVRHEASIAGLFGEVLGLCARSGLVRVGVVAVDGTKIAAAATHHATRSYEQIAREILEDAARIDAAEDELYGDSRGDELPEGLRTSGDRRKVLREAKQALDAERAAQARKIPRDRSERLVECRRRLRQDWELERHVVAEHAAWHAAGIASDGSRRMVEVALRELECAGVSDTPGVVLADAGYWKNDAIEALCADGIPTLVAPDADRRKQPRPGRRGGLYDFTRRVLATDWGKELYLRRQGIVEPVFGQVKSNRGANRFLRRGRSAVRSEWRLLMATHNLLKLHRHQLAA